MKIPPYRTSEKGQFQLMKWIEELRLKLKPVPEYKSGTGSPEGVVDGTTGDEYFRTDGTTGSLVYRKTTASGNTGWVAV